MTYEIRMIYCLIHISKSKHSFELPYVICSSFPILSPIRFTKNGWLTTTTRNMISILAHVIRILHPPAILCQRDSPIDTVIPPTVNKWIALHLSHVSCPSQGAFLISCFETNLAEGSFFLSLHSIFCCHLHFYVSFSHFFLSKPFRRWYFLHVVDLFSYLFLCLPSPFLNL